MAAREKNLLNDKKVTAENNNHCTKMKFSLMIWSRLLKRSLMKNFIFCTVNIAGLKVEAYSEPCQTS